MICPRDAELLEAQRIDDLLIETGSVHWMDEDQISDRLASSQVTIVLEKERKQGQCKCYKCKLKRLCWSIETLIAQIFYWKPRCFWYNLQNKIEQRGK